jgi:hypothetical protein
MGGRGGGSELSHSFFSLGPMKRREVMILYYDTEGYMRRNVVSWLSLVSHDGGERRCRIKSFRFGGGSLLGIVSALAP